jgi:hypothetical protein
MPEALGGRQKGEAVRLALRCAWNGDRGSEVTYYALFAVSWLAG